MANTRGRAPISDEPNAGSDIQEPVNTPEDGADNPDDFDIVAAALEDFRTAAIAEQPLRDEQAEDNRVMNGRQWDPRLKAMRDQDMRPVLTINRAIQFRNQIVNNVRQNRPAITVMPMDGVANKETAEVFQGQIRHIETQSYASVAYDTALEMAVNIGRGYLFLDTKWIGTDFDQEITIGAVDEFESCYLDPSYTEFDASDAHFGMRLMDELRDEYERRWGHISPVASLDRWATGTLGRRHRKDWLPKGRVRLAKYYWIEEQHEKRVIARVSLPPDDEHPNGETNQAIIWQSAIKPLEDLGATVLVLKSRIAIRKTCRWALINAVDVLEQGTYPGTRIPIVPVVGNMMNVDGERDFFGITRPLRDPQRMYNVWVSAQTETIALAPRSPFIVAIDQIKGFQDLWREANRRNYAYLPYHPKVQGDQLVPPPQRNSFEPPINAIMQATRQADNDMKGVTGIYDASLGEQGPQESGKAIGQRKLQGEVANFHYVDNLARAMTSLGRLLIEWVPVIYDVPQTRRILGIDNKPKLAIIHAGNQDAANAMLEDAKKLDEGIERTYDLSVGRYDVVVSTGAAFESRRQESADFMQRIIEAYPTLVPIIGDIVFDEIDTPGASKIAERLKKALPPELQDDKGKAQPDPAQLQQQLAAASQQIQAMGAELEQLKSEQATKMLDIASREKIAAFNNDTKVLLEAMKQHQVMSMQAIELQASKNSQAQAETHAMIQALLGHLSKAQTPPGAPGAAPGGGTPPGMPPPAAPEAPEAPAGP